MHSVPSESGVPLFQNRKYVIKLKELREYKILKTRGCHIHTYCRVICSWGQTQKLSSHTRNYTVKRQNENFNPQSNKTNLLKVYEPILDYSVFIAATSSRCVNNVTECVSC